MKRNQSFGQAIEALQSGGMVSRDEWNGKGLFVFRQVPSKVPAEVISRMTSLPEMVKATLIERGSDITYKNQFCIVYPDNSLHGWQPSGSDVLANDWCIWESSETNQEPVIAGETVGTASVLPPCDHDECPRTRCVYGSVDAEKIKDKVMEWISKSDSEIRLSIGEASSQEIRTLQAVLRSILV